jgi:ferredoxin
MKVTVDHIKCHGIGICVKDCPEVFRFEPGSKRAVSRYDEVPPAFREKARSAAAECPNGAIFVEEE